jgi:hypothetical protein
LPGKWAEGGGKGSFIVEGAAQSEDKNERAYHKYVLQREPYRDFAQHKYCERADGVTGQYAWRSRGQGDDHGGEDEHGYELDSAIQPMDARILIGEFVYMRMVHNEVPL